MTKRNGRNTRKAGQSCHGFNVMVAVNNVGAKTQSGQPRHHGHTSGPQQCGDLAQIGTICNRFVAEPFELAGYVEDVHLRASASVQRVVGKENSHGH